jgi:hypothetical protein
MRSKKAVAPQAFVGTDPAKPATLESVVAAVMRLSTLDEAELLDLVSTGRLEEVFPFRPGGEQRAPADFVAEADLIEASPKPLKRRERHALIQSSIAAAQAKEPRRPAAATDARTPAKSARSRSINARLRSSPQR